MRAAWPGLVVAGLLGGVEPARAAWEVRTHTDAMDRTETVMALGPAAEGPDTVFGTKASALLAVRCLVGETALGVSVAWAGDAFVVEFTRRPGLTTHLD
jgi:hypothetical protein